MTAITEWEQTDASCNQYRRTIVEGQIYEFKEDRIINPETGETETVSEILDYEDYDWHEIVDACETFGYSAKQIDKWITGGEEIPLMLECIFELSS